MIVMRQTAGGVVIDGKLVPLRVEDGSATLPEPQPEAPPSVEDDKD